MNTEEALTVAIDRLSYMIHNPLLYGPYFTDEYVQDAVKELKVLRNSAIELREANYDVVKAFTKHSA